MYFAHYSTVFIVDFEQNSHIVLVTSLLTLLTTINPIHVLSVFKGKSWTNLTPLSWVFVVTQAAYTCSKVTI